MTSALTILLVDEEPILRRATALMLTGRGGKVSAVATLGEAIALSKQQTFDVAVIDIAADDPRPAELIAELGERGLLPPRVVVCSCAPLDRYEAQPFAAVIPKPYVFEHLVSAIFGPRRRRQPSRSGVAPRASVSDANRLARVKRTANAALLQLSMLRGARAASGAKEAVPSSTRCVGVGRAMRLRTKPEEVEAQRRSSTDARQSSSLPFRAMRRAVRARRGRE